MPLKEVDRLRRLELQFEDLPLVMPLELEVAWGHRNDARPVREVLGESLDQRPRGGDDPRVDRWRTVTVPVIRETGKPNQFRADRNREGGVVVAGDEPGLRGPPPRRLRRAFMPVQRRCRHAQYSRQKVVG